MSAATVSRGPNKEARFDYVIDGNSNTLLIEKIEGGVLETLFDNDGGVLKQVALKGGDEVIEAEVEKMVKGIGSVSASEYRKVTLKKACPYCGRPTLERVLDTDSNGNKGVPIVPTYICTSCGNRSYYLTDTYLKTLVFENKGLFTEDEKRELEDDEEKFLHELKEYIIRIFASKRIKAIR